MGCSSTKLLQKAGRKTICSQKINNIPLTPFVFFFFLLVKELIFLYTFSNLCYLNQI